MLEAIFRSDEFYSPQAYHAKVKSPVEFVVGGVRMLGASINPRVMVGYSYRMGQLLFLPPNVGGWPQDLNWINTSTMFWRFNFVNALQTRRQTPESAFDPVSIVKSSGIKTPEMLVDQFLKQLAHSDVPAETRSAIIDLASVDAPADLTTADPRTVESRVLETVRMIMATPEYQLA
jgi:hypothetical protein